MLCVNSQGVFIPDVAYQVVNECNNHCENCYLGDKQTDTTVIEEIIQLVWNERLSCHSFTLSLNSRWKPEVDPIEVYTLIRVLSEKDITINITVHSYNDLLNWLPLSALSMVTGITFSAVPEDFVAGTVQSVREWNPDLTVRFAHIARQRSVKMYNVLPRDVHNFLLLEKEPLGTLIPTQNISNYDFIAWNTRRNFLPDTCVREIETHKTCRAGSARIHIWSDGSVTACPYDSHNRGEPEGNLFTRIIEAIDTPFEKCNLPEVICNQ